MARRERVGRTTPTVDVAWSRVRGLAAVLAGAAVVLAPDAFPTPAGMAPRAVGVVLVGALIGINLLAGHRRRRQPRAATLLILVEVAGDLAVAMALTVFAGGGGGPQSMLLAIPLVEAGLRFGTLGLCVAWGIVVGGSAAEIAFTVPVNQFGEVVGRRVAEVVGLALVALPTSYVAEHLILAVHRAEVVNARSDERASILEVLTRGWPNLATLDRATILDETAAIARDLGVIEPVVVGGSPEPGERAVVAPLDGGRSHLVLSGTDADPRWVLQFDRPAEAPAFLDEALEVLGLQVSIALATAERYAEVEQLRARHERESQTDALTGLPNRRALESVAAASGFAGRDDWAVVFVDLDGFKVVNDTIGHERGDAVLREAAGQIARLAAPHQAFRLGGDEFAVVLRDGDAAAVAPIVRDRVRELVRVESVTADGSTVLVRASAGLARPRSGASLLEVLREADLDMYRDKRRSRVVGGSRGGPS